MLAHEDYVTTLSQAYEFPHHKNQVSSLTTQHIIFLRKTRGGLELVPYSLAGCTEICYRSRWSPVWLILGASLVALISSIVYFLTVYWDSLAPGAEVPLGALAIAGAYGMGMVRDSKSHVLIFRMKDGKVLKWASRRGDFKEKQAVVARVIEFAKAIGKCKSNST